MLVEWFTRLSNYQYIINIIDIIINCEVYNKLIASWMVHYVIQLSINIIDNSINCEVYY